MMRNKCYLAPVKQLFLLCLVVLVAGTITTCEATGAPVVDEQYSSQYTSVTRPSNVLPYTYIETSCNLVLTIMPETVAVDWSKVPTPTCYVQRTSNYLIVLAVTKWDQYGSYLDFCSLRTKAYKGIHIGYCEVDATTEIPAKLDDLVAYWHVHETYYGKN